MKGTISLRQASCIMGILVFANKVLILPSIMFERVGVDGIFLLLGLFLVDIAMLVAFFKLKTSFPDKTFFQLLAKVITKYGAIFVYVLFCGFFIMKALTIYNVSLMYLKNQVYFEVGEYIFLICFIAISNNMAFRGLRSTARTTEFFYIGIILLIVLSTYAACANFADFPIFFNNSFGELSLSSFSYLFCFGDALFLFLVMDKIEIKNEKKRTMFISVGVNMVLTILLYAVFFSVFKYTGFMHNNAASDVITFSNNFAGVGRIDIISVIVIMFLNYFQLTFYNIAFQTSFSAVFPRGNKVFSTVIYDLVFILLLYFFVSDYTKVFAIDTNVMPYFALVLQYIIPLVCLLPIFFKKRRRYE